LYYVTYEYRPYTLSLGGTTIPGLLLEDDQAVLDSQVRSHNAEENRPGSNNVVNKVRVALNLSLFFFVLPANATMIHQIEEPKTNTTIINCSSNFNDSNVCDLWVIK
jgi:hypothetical protein